MFHAGVAAGAACVVALTLCVMLLRQEQYAQFRRVLMWSNLAAISIMVGGWHVCSCCGVVWCMLSGVCSVLMTVGQVQGLWFAQLYRVNCGLAPPSPHSSTNTDPTIPLYFIPSALHSIWNAHTLTDGHQHEPVPDRQEPAAVAAADAGAAVQDGRHLAHHGCTHAQVGSWVCVGGGVETEPVWGLCWCVVCVVRREARGEAVEWTSSKHHSSPAPWPQPQLAPPTVGGYIRLQHLAASPTVNNCLPCCLPLFVLPHQAALAGPSCHVWGLLHLAVLHLGAPAVCAPAQQPRRCCICEVTCGSTGHSDGPGHGHRCCYCCWCSWCGSSKW